ncbi:hypothetical protein [Nostoc sp.]|uniref:hypothetical protein n=1 Tax=Nostoc sp. TaxID=1180 RepID=UPI0035932D98
MVNTARLRIFVGWVEAMRYATNPARLLSDVQGTQTRFRWRYPPFGLVESLMGETTPGAIRVARRRQLL